MLAVALSLVAAAAWGVADFGGGLFSRRLPVAAVLFVVEAGGLIAATLIVVVFAHSWPSGHTVLMSCLAGTAGMIGLAFFYGALSVGKMSVVAPVSSTGAVIPVVVGLVTGDTLTTVVATGLAIAFAGIVLSAQEADDSSTDALIAAGIWRALGAAAGFGAFFVLYKEGAQGSKEWAIFWARVPATVLVGALMVSRSIPLPRGQDLRRLALLGQMDAAAVGFYALAITRGALSVVAVVGSLYPVVTVLLARGLLGERLRPVQLAGITAAFAGVALVSAGSVLPLRPRAVSSVG